MLSLARKGLVASRTISQNVPAFFPKRTGILVHAKPRSREILMIIDDPLDALFEARCAEINQNTYRQVEQAKVGHNLPGMDGQNILHAFQLHE